MSPANQALRDAEAMLVSVTKQLQGRPALRDEQVRRKLLALQDALPDLASGDSGASKRAERVLAVEVLGMSRSGARYLERWVPRAVQVRSSADVLYALDKAAELAIWSMRRGVVKQEAPRLLAAVAGLFEVAGRA